MVAVGNERLYIMQLRVYPINTYIGHLWWKTWYKKYALQEFQNKKAPDLAGGDLHYKKWVTLSIYDTVEDAIDVKQKLEKANG